MLPTSDLTVKIIKKFFAAVMYLCPKRISPNLNGNGIFITIPGAENNKCDNTL